MSQNKYVFFIFLLLAACIQESIGECPKIIKRKQWGAKRNTNVNYMIIPVKYVIVQHTATPECDTLNKCSDRVFNIQHHHMNTLDYHDIGINFLIGGDGNVYEGTGWHLVGAHTFGWNSKSLGVAFIGDFTDKLPTKDALDAFKKLMECGVEKGELDDRYQLLGHRQVLSTNSPGTTLFHEITTWPHHVDEP